MGTQTTPPSRSISTSGNVAVEVVTVETLKHSHIGKEIAVQGRDITVGQHLASPITIAGTLDSYRVSKRRAVLTMMVQIRTMTARQPRIVEIFL